MAKYTKPASVKTIQPVFSSNPVKSFPVLENTIHPVGGKSVFNRKMQQLRVDLLSRHRIDFPHGCGKKNNTGKEYGQ
jgi:hypothetical protein